MTKSVNINLDLEITPLQIMTNTLLGHSDNVRIYIVGVNGFITINFRHKIFQIDTCGHYAFPSHLLEERIKIWTISRTKEALTVLCNGVEVLNMVYAEYDKYCTRKWTKDSTIIKLWSDDLASDYMRILSEGKKVFWTLLQQKIYTDVLLKNEY